MIGVERGWQLRREKSGSRVAGVRTFALLGGGGGIAALLGTLVHPAVGVVIVAAMAVALLIGFHRQAGERDATGVIAALLAVSLGLLAGAGQPALAVAGGAVVTFILSIRRESHAILGRLTATDVKAFARYAVIVAAVLPFLPNRSLGPFAAWNPFQLWLVVVLVTGFSLAGYVANRTIGARNGILASAVIGGAYSSTAVTASFARRLGTDEAGPLTAGILVASAIMYVRVTILIALLSPSTLPSFLIVIGPAAMVGAAIAVVAWLRSSKADAANGESARNPVELLPALMFVAIVAAGAVGTRWAQQSFGQQGAALSLFITGTFDVDAAIVTLSGLPAGTLVRDVAAVAIAGTVVANMLVKMAVTGLFARWRGSTALIGLGASTAVLIGTMVWRLVMGVATA
jgi:uncharacterized membrane protein (DUF4010 family)